MGLKARFARWLIVNACEYSISLQEKLYESKQKHKKYNLIRGGECMSEDISKRVNLSNGFINS